MDLIQRILSADPRAIARAMSSIENGDLKAREILKGIYFKTGQALVIGVTGAPGSGKSTLVNKLALDYRKLGKLVGIIAVDPTSPFSGGAILADRIRMQALYDDEGVFIRSMATRGHIGGLSHATREVVSVLDAAGKDVILIETVGVGQDEIEIVKVADISVVVLVPGMGDELQTLKAGIMEIGDLFVINKADRAGVGKFEKELESMLTLDDRSENWKPLVVKTVATQGEGVSELIAAIDRFDQFRKTSPQSLQSRKYTVRENLIDLLKERLLEKATQQNGVWEKIQAASQDVKTRKTDPYTAVEEIVRDLTL
jgi:LAO/AO transport system kinase